MAVRMRSLQYSDLVKSALSCALGNLRGVVTLLCLRPARSELIAIEDRDRASLIRKLFAPLTGSGERESGRFHEANKGHQPARSTTRNVYSSRLFQKEKL